MRDDSFAPLWRGARLQLPAGVQWPSTLFQVSLEFDADLQAGKLAGYTPIPTGFAQLDAYLGGGLVPESLVVLGGPPGVGKTIFALQAARNIAEANTGTIALVVCFEHGETYLYHRLLCLESLCAVGGAGDGVTMEDLRRAALMKGEHAAGLGTLIETLPAARAAWLNLVEYWERLLLVKGAPDKTTPNVMDTYLTVLRQRYPRVVLFVDYLQKTPVFAPGVELTPDRHIKLVTEGLKNLALKHGIPIVAIAASEAEGLKGERVRFEDLWGGASIKYEPDVAIMLNPARDQERNASRGKRVYFSIEKNRLGPTDVTIEYILRGENFAFVAAEG